MLVYPDMIIFVIDDVPIPLETISCVKTPDPLNVIVVPFTVVDIIYIYITLLIKLK
jgi:hypothetical protein